ncbi:MAG: YkvA family protein [Bacillota bacterium]|nr:YkvA family protein [Bacillota bacterium]
MNNNLNEKIKNRLSSLKQKSKKIKKDIGALYFAYKRPDVPLHAKLVLLLVVGYALSPIDLIPDFIPILGYMDDLILLPLGITLAIKLIPSHIMAECRQQSEEYFAKGKPKNWIAGGIIIFIWLLAAAYILMKIFHWR